MTTLTTVKQSFLFDFMETWIKESTSPVRAMGSRKMDEARAEGHKHGKEQGLRNVLAMYANELRRARFRELNLPDDRPNWVPAVSGSYFVQWLNGISKAWVDGAWKDATDEEFFTDVADEFMELVFSEDFENVYLGARKDAVRTGCIEPNESDREWIEEEHKAYMSMAQPLGSLLEKIKPEGKS